MPAPRLRSSLVVLVLTIPLDLGCKPEVQETVVPDENEEDSLDALTRDLLLALRQNDEARIAELAAPELLASLAPPARVELHETLDWLGYVDEIERISEQPVEGGIERRYSIQFENGKVELTVTTAGDRIEGLQFDEAVWAAIVQLAADKAVGDLRVIEFEFTTPDGERLSAPTNPKAIHYTIALDGLAISLREHQVSIHKEVFDAKGALVYKEREDEELRFPEADVGSSGGRIKGSVVVPKKGSFELELQITDKIAGDTIVHRQPFTIE
jgi:hypothetical protein